MDTKTEKAVNFWIEGRKKESLKLFSKFKIGISKFDKQTLEVANEINTGKDLFYTQIGYDVDKIMRDAYFIIEEYVAKYKSVKLNKC